MQPTHASSYPCHSGGGATTSPAHPAAVSRMEESPGDAECHRSPNHADRMMRKMEGYFAKRQLCDIVLVVGTKRISAHRIVLSSASDYFAAMFTNDVREATQEEVKLKDVDPEALATLIHYMYTGKTLTNGLCTLMECPF